MPKTFRLPVPVLLWATIALSIAFRIIVSVRSGYTIDDSWITFRYAENLIAGNGLVYNLDEAVQGSTTPLQIFLLAMLMLFGLEARAAALLICLAATAGFLWCAFRLLEILSARSRSPFYILPLGVAPGLIILSISGMETMLFLFLQIATMWAYVDRRPLSLGALAAFLMLTRIDGVLVIVAIVAVDTLLRLRSAAAHAPADRVDREFRTPWPARDIVKAAGLSAVLVMPWIVYATWYYGNPVPNSVWAKHALYGEAGLDRTPVAELLDYVFRLGFYLPWQIGAGISLTGLAYCAARLDRFSVVAIWFVVYLIFLIAGQTHVHPWYVAPFHAFALLSACIFASQLTTAFWHWIEGRWASRSMVAACWVFLPLICAWGLWASNLSASTLQQKYRDAHVAVGSFLEREAKSGDVIYAPDIGYIGAMTGLRILDSAGIISPEVIPFNRRGDFAGVLKAMQPTWAVIGLYGHWQEPLLGDRWIRDNYSPVYRNKPDRPVDWPPPEELAELKYDRDYLVLKKVTDLK
jgi:hypothetical protein